MRSRDNAGITTPRSVLVMTAIIVAGVAVAWWVNRESAPARDADRITTNGTIETEPVRVGFKFPGRLVTITAREGQAVRKGQELGRLDDQQLRAQVAQAQATAAAAQANLRLLEAGARPQEIRRAELAEAQAQSNYQMVELGARRQEVTQVRAGVSQAEANWRLASDNLQRIQGLHRQQVVSRQQLDAAVAQETVARKQLQAARASLDLVVSGARPEQVAIAEQQWRAAQQQTSLVRAGSRSEQIAAARAQWQQAQAGIKVLQSQLADTVARSPVDGVVLSRAAESGEVIGAGSPICTVADLRTVWLRVYVPEALVGLVKLGQAVRVTADSFPGRDFAGRVAEISPQAEFTPKNVQTKDERVTQVFAVRVRVPNPDQALKPGLPVDAQVLVREPGEGPGRL